MNALKGNQVPEEQFVEEIDVGDYLLFNNCDQSRSDHSSESES